MLDPQQSILTTEILPVPGFSPFKILNLPLPPSLFPFPHVIPAFSHHETPRQSLSSWWRASHNSVVFSIPFGWLQNIYHNLPQNKVP